MFYHWATGDSVAHHLLLTTVSSSSVVEHPTWSRRVVGSNPIWDLGFFLVYVFPRIYIISCCYLSVSKFRIKEKNISQSCFAFSNVLENPNKDDLKRPEYLKLKGSYLPCFGFLILFTDRNSTSIYRSGILLFNVIAIACEQALGWV